MQIYGMSPRCSRREATSPIFKGNFELKGVAYPPVFMVTLAVNLSTQGV